jgi:hypothetical protein
VSRLGDVGLGLALAVLVGISLVSLPAQQWWAVPGARHAPWCLPGQSPSFQFGFESLAEATGGVMGAPIECEHGAEKSNGDTTQKTTTGVATYSWCTNAPGFTRGDEHWLLTADGLEHWSGASGPPRPLPEIREPDLRNLCPG